MTAGLARQTIEWKAAVSLIRHLGLYRFVSDRTAVNSSGRVRSALIVSGACDTLLHFFLLDSSR
jgi:hypothetical protein